MDNRKHKSKMMGDTQFLFLGTKINVLEYMVDLKLKINRIYSIKVISYIYLIITHL